MDIHITTRHCTLTDHENEAAVKAATHFGKFYDNILRVDAILEQEHGAHLCEYTVKVGGHTIVAKEQGQDFSRAIHDAAEKIVRQLTKLNDRQHDVRSPLARP